MELHSNTLKNVILLFRDPLAFQYGQDPGVACLSYISWVLWLLGFSDQALKKSTEAIRLAQRLQHPFSLALALSFAAWLHQFRKEMQLTNERAESARSLSIKKGFRFWIGWEMVMQGWALDEAGAIEKRVEMIRQGLENWRSSGSELGRPYFLAILAEVCGQGDQADKGLYYLKEALQLMDDTKERWCQAELYRIKGELLLSKSTENQDQAEACFQQALKIAQRQQAKAWKLKSAISLSRHWIDQGKDEEAQRLLRRTLSRFTEGFETIFLKEAKELLKNQCEQVSG